MDSEKRNTTSTSPAAAGFRGKVAVIGAGAMGGATVRGLIEAGTTPSDIFLANPTESKLAPFARLGVNVTCDNAAAIAGASLIVIAVKPWILPAVAAQLRDAIDFSRQEVAVIVASVSGEELMMMFDRREYPCGLSIVMPNTAMTLRRSMTFVVEVDGSCPLAVEALSLLGCVKIIEERLLGAATSLASCGIAYAMRYVRAAMEGGVQLGFRASDAQEIIVATIKGAAALLAAPGAHPESEIDKVTTPGGLTIRGLNAMEAAGFTPAVIAGLIPDSLRR